jgi:hypothetical protein
LLIQKNLAVLGADRLTAARRLAARMGRPTVKPSGGVRRPAPSAELEELGAHVQAAQSELLKAEQDIRDKNEDRLKADMRARRGSPDVS